MNANLDIIAKELYGKIQTRFNDIKIGDENATVLSKKEDIPKARFFEFEYEEDGEPLGTITITLDESEGVVVQVSGDLVNDRDKTTHHGAYKFLRSFRQFAKDRLLNFDIQNIGKSNLDKRDYQYQAKRKELPVMAQAPIMENKMYGSNRISYQDLGEARLIVKHSQPINTELPAGRTMHIEGIYIESAQGERFLYPVKHLNGARALAEHIKHGGTPYDAIGTFITGLSEELASLRKFKGYVSRQSQLSEAMANVTSRVADRMEEIKETISKLQRKAYYEEFAESFEAQEEVMIPEEIQNDLIDRLTIRTYNEELTSVFPYIYKFIDESELPVVELGVNDLLEDPAVSEGSAHGYNVAKWYEKYSDQIKLTKWLKKEAGLPKDADVYFDDADLVYDVETIVPNALVNPKLKFNDLLTALVNASGSGQAKTYSDGTYRESVEDQFESFMDRIISEDKDELFSPNPGAKNKAVSELNDLLSSELSGGEAGVLALKGIIDDPEFIDKVQVLQTDEEIRAELKDYVLDKDPDLLTVLTNLEKAGEAPPEPIQTPAPEVEPVPVPAEPVPAEEPAVGATPPEEVPPATPVAEGEDPPFDPDTKPSKKTTAGKHGQGYSQARHLARQGLAKAIEKAKKAGAKLDTKMTIGGKEMTLQDAIRECGCDAAEFGFDEPEETGLPAMLKYISGFYNKEEGNFPLGGQRIKIKVKKAFEDGEFGDTDEAELIKVLKFIDMKDPSHSGMEQETMVPSDPGAVEMPEFESGADTLQSQLSETVSFGNEISLARIIELSRR